MTAAGGVGANPDQFLPALAANVMGLEAFAATTIEEWEAQLRGNVTNASAFLLSAVNDLAARADASTDQFAALLDGLFGTGHAIQDLVNYLQAIPGSVIDGITVIEQAILDAIAQALGHAGTGHTTTDILGYLGLIPGANITGPLNTAVTISGNAISSLFSASGTLASQLTGALNPGVTFLVGASNVALSTLLTNINATGGLLASGVTGALNPAVTFLVGASNVALSTLLGNITATGLFSAPSITGALNTAVTISGNAVSSLFNSSGTLASALTGAINPSVTFLVGASNVALSTLLQYINSSGQFNAAQLTGALNTALTISSKTLANLVTNIDSAGLLAASGLTGALNPAVTFLVGASNIALSTLLQNLNATGQLAGSAITGAINTAATVGGVAIGTIGTNATTAAAGIASLLSGAIGSIQNSFPTTFPVTFATAPTIDQVGTLINSFVPRAELQQLYDLIHNISTGPGVADIQGATQAQVAAGLTQLQQAAASGTAVAQQALADAAAAVAGVPAQITSALSTAQINAANLTGTIPTSVTLPDITLAASTALQTLHNDIVNNLRGFQFPGLNWAPTNTAGALASTVATMASNTTNVLTVQANATSSYGYGLSGGLNASETFTGSLPSDFTATSSIATYTAKYNVSAASTDIETVTGMWSTPPPDGGAYYLILRANTGFTDYVYLKLATGHWDIGCVVGGFQTVFSAYNSYGISGSTATDAARAAYEGFDADHPYNAFLTNVQFAFQANGLGFYTNAHIFIGSRTPALKYTDSGTSQTNSSHRYGGYGTDEAAGLPGAITSWTFYDSGPPAGPAAAYVATSETTTSTTYADLATTTDTVSVVVGSSGMLLVSMSATVTGSVTQGIYHMGFALSGANTLAAADSYAASLFIPVTTANLTAIGNTFLLTGLTAGSTTVKLKYRVQSGGGTGTYATRRISAIPL